MHMQWKYSELLDGLSDADLLSIEAHASSRVYKQNDSIIRDGANDKSLYIIEDGEVAIIKDQMVLAQKKSGHHFGFMALIDDSPRSADVVATTECKIIEINIEEIKLLSQSSLFQSLLANHFIIIQKSLRMMNEITAAEMKDRLEVTKAISAIRSDLSSDLHDDVGSLLAGIAMQSELISNQIDVSNQPSSKDKRYIDNICSLSREAMKNMRDIVWAIDSSHIKYQNLIDRIHDHIYSTLDLLGINCSFQKEGFESESTIDQHVKQNLYLIFKEAITNITKHASAKHVKISLIKRDHELSLTIKDDGSAPINSNNSGIGLNSMKKRAQKMNASIEFIHDEGFEVRLSIPI